MMEVQTEQESTAGLASATTTLTAAPGPETVDHAAVAMLLRKRLEKFVPLVPESLVGDDPDAVHDARVWSRRLQQCLEALFPKPWSGKVRRLRRILRRVRRNLGEWRNCDVMLRLVAREQRRTRSSEKRDAWEVVREYLLAKRSDEVAWARRKLVQEDMVGFSAAMMKLMEVPTEENPQELSARLRAGIESAWARWQSALALAQQSRDATDIHAFRIASKALRYRVELCHDLGDRETKPIIGWLKELQERLGNWHDRQVLNLMVAKALARPKYLLDRPHAARALLRQLERERSRQEAATHEIIRVATEHPGRARMEVWLGS